ncbi:MAG: Excinuclease ABC C subunit domain protein [Candidatus Uhrbacteria bacterium GW2011_GWF2_41_16]|jgi:excinuclease ABC subunit C|uniref:Excinuclease ABC C subunit domain protein n=2 Tax=Candidatus Uhriibacteriota TaxID=1752732 RepID=A0A0G0XM61_9BACT|nr:MAG: Excinuclease ABC C subunit domain protein [Candidatus Uhrbacteria bacterium GW2011_GWC2_41_11]KKR97880.1 MAG: Excinuclease ABC C subunit domain protein [Candidatus Uhrbacteria bacterium GW2011_GWF2_41_16]
MIPSHITIKNKELPDSPGVYFYYDMSGELLYVGKATSLKKRVGSYFTKAHDNRIADMVSNIARIDYVQTGTVIEALVLEANQIKAKRPKYNILQRDDKTFLYLVITNEAYPRPLLMRGLELERLHINPFERKLSPVAKKHFLAVFGPYTSAQALRRALDLIRKMIPWSICQPPEVTGKRKACFNVHIKKCPGVCTGAITAKEYHRIIRQLILFFEGRKTELMREIKKEMEHEARLHRFEQAAKLRNNLFALEHIQDVALVMKEDADLPFAKIEQKEGIDLNGRIECYDISNISGTSAVGSMVVFLDGKPAKKEYRKFKIKTVQGSNDVAMMEEVLRRRLARVKQFPDTWPLPVLMVIDGGEGQVGKVQDVLNQFDVQIPLVGLAKGFDRKQDRLVFDSRNLALAQVVERGKQMFQQARDEAHRFAIKYHRELRGKSFVKKN